MAVSKRIRGEARMGMNQKEALWLDLKEDAKAGDPVARRIVADRIWPKLKPVAPTIEFDYVGETISEKMDSVMVAVAAGKISPDHVKPLIEALKEMRISMNGERMQRDSDARKAKQVVSRSISYDY